MIIIGNLLSTVASILGSVISVYSLIVIVAALISWVNPDPYNPIVRTLRMLTEPVFYRIRKWLPFVYIGGVDLSPLVLLLALQLVQGVVVNSLRMYALGM